MFRILFCFLIVGVFYLSGCGKSTEERETEKAIEAATGGEADVDISDDGAKMTLTTEQGTLKVATGEKASIPKDFPKDVPVYEDAKVQTAMVIPGGYALVLLSDDKVDDIVKTLKSDIEKKGWANVNSVALGPQTMLAYKKGERQLAIVIGKNEGHYNTLITMNIQNGGE